MHVMHVIDSLNVGGAERMLVELANRTALDGHRVSVCVTRSGASLSDELINLVSLRILNRIRRFDWKPMRYLDNLVREGGVDVLHVHGRSTYSLVAFMKSTGMLKVPVILHYHFGIELDESAPTWFRLWARHYLTHFVGVYEKLGKWAEKAGVPATRISIIENAMDADPLLRASATDLRKEFGIQTNTLIGIVVANFRYEKGIDVLLEALARTSARQKVKILIVGKEWDPKYAQLCREKSRSLGLNDRVLAVGERRDVCSFLKGGDFAVMPSRSESGPIVLIEYMSAGLPFVSTITGGIAETASKHDVPGFIPADNAVAMSSALDELINLTDQERLERGRKGQKVAIRLFDIRRIMPRWYQLYNRAINEN